MADKITRRTLIELGIAAGATAAVTTSAAARPTALSDTRRAALPDDQKLGFAVVGIGKLSQGQIIPGLRKCTGAKLSALVSGHPDKAAQWAAKEGLAADAIYNYENYDRIVNDPRIDVVYIVLPNYMHAEYTIRALKAGKHVLCEKPMATSVDDCEAMIAAAKAANRKLMIAYRCHYEPHNLEAMRRIRSGKIRQAAAGHHRNGAPVGPLRALRRVAARHEDVGRRRARRYGDLRRQRRALPSRARSRSRSAPGRNTDRTDPRFKDYRGSDRLAVPLPLGRDRQRIDELLLCRRDEVRRLLREGPAARRSGRLLRRQPPQYLQPPRSGRSPDHRRRPVRPRDGLDGRCRCAARFRWSRPARRECRTCG